MRSFIFILSLVFLFFNHANASIFELNRCITGSEAQKKNVKWSSEKFKQQNTIYYKFLDKPKKYIWGYDVLAWVPEIDLDKKEIKEFLDNGFKKIRRAEKHLYSIDTTNGVITKLIIYNDNWVQTRLDEHFKLVELYKKDGTYFQKQKDLDLSFDIISKKRKIDEFKIEKFVDNLIIAHRIDQYYNYPEERFAIMVDIRDLTVAFDQVKNLNNLNRLSLSVCGTNNANENSNKDNNSTLKSILKMLN